ncbi:MAG TPA: hypothetical protein VMD04_02070 [Candidatus Margulisiibacteriota bacterium]|nr:hypothetical protein [Candidatus Margulisiibacteriota bacterium]
MKVFNIEVLYGLTRRINLLLTLSAVALLIYLIFNVRQPYQPASKSSDLKTQGAELMHKEAAILEGSVAFQEDIFRKKQLFSSSGGKGFALGSATPILLGISMGNKKLAMIRDTRLNKDYYCMEGDKIGEYTVKQILKNQVILEGASGNLLEINQ